MTVLVVDCTSSIIKKRITTLCGRKNPAQFASKSEAEDLVKSQEFSSIITFGIDSVRTLLPHLSKNVLVMFKIQFRELALPHDEGIIPLFPIPSLIDMEKEGDKDSYKRAMNRVIEKAVKAKPYKISLDYNYQQVKTVAELKQVFARLKQEPIVSFDIETVGLFPFKQQLSRPVIYSIAFAFDDGDVFALPVETYWKPATQVAVKQALAKWLVELAPDQIRIAHNSKFELKWMLEHCLPAADLHWSTSRPVGKYEDTQLLMWSLHAGVQGTLSLKFGAPIYLGVDNWGIDVSDVRQQPLDKLLHYNALDSFYTLRLWQRIHPMVAAQPSLLAMYDNIMLPASNEFVQIELRGVPYDKQVATHYANKCKAIKAEAMQEIVKHAGRPLLPTEPEALIRYFKGKGYKWSGKTATGGLAMGEEQLQEIETKYNDPICKSIIAFKKASKVLTTYIEGPQRFLTHDNRIKAVYNLTKAVTGRTSSDSPNMQNFPKRKGKEIRECFVAPPGYVFASFDYGQIEARLFGVLTGDKQFCKDLFSGVDMHLTNAEFIFGKDKAAEMRGPTKNGTFATLYGSSVNSLMRTLGITKQKATQLVSFIFDKYPQFKRWQQGLLSLCKKIGYVEGLTGRRRREPISYNETLNHPLQSSASDLTLISMIHLSRKYELIMMIHDDLTFLLKEENLEDQIEEIVEAMLVLPWLYIYKSKYNKAWIPLQVEVEVGSNWANQEPVLKADCLEIGIDNQDQCVKRAQELHEYFMNYKPGDD